ncbi:aa3-type cytochrome c oxidase subunit IV [Hankyongella ginsenosidimutans]|uniref:Aa3-type cytochrome c oxidase subunit IV n=1 Tax=Hankyongella ginsenosidimutans TaxID=1763828 RepID=A0A4D7BVL3_9SPHN|nr:aa3-type cytochrome c oxidase subunit IV [Hankyongella ginsenosidimutans]TXG81507.1 MAG: aa3-type cytochrome c oxidase subunit IV [Sphingomonadales bacterium]
MRRKSSFEGIAMAEQNSMDYAEHKRTWRGFMGFVKWGIPLSLILFGVVLWFTT